MSSGALSLPKYICFFPICLETYLSKLTFLSELIWLPYQMTSMFIWRNFAYFFSPHHTLYAITIITPSIQIKKLSLKKLSNLHKVIHFSSGITGIWTSLVFALPIFSSTWHFHPSIHPWRSVWCCLTGTPGLELLMVSFRKACMRESS